MLADRKELNQARKTLEENKKRIAELESSLLAKFEAFTVVGYKTQAEDFKSLLDKETTKTASLSSDVYELFHAYQSY